MWTVIDTPMGQVRVAEADGAIVVIDFYPADAETGGRGSLWVVGERDDEVPVLVEAARQLRQYFAGERRTFDLPLAPVGTPFQQQVWGELTQIPYGETWTYGQIAARLGLTGHGARAVGLANGRNPISIVVPCHRVIGANGALTGYAGGLDAKLLLLELEGFKQDAALF